MRVTNSFQEWNLICNISKLTYANHLKYESLVYQIIMGWSTIQNLVTEKIESTYIFPYIDKERLALGLQCNLTRGN